MKKDRIKNRPIVGSFVSKAAITKLMKKQENYRMEKFERGSKVAGVTLFFFCIQDVDFKNLQINGSYYDTKKDVWAKGRFPFPDILYNRRSEGKKQRNVKKFKSLLKIDNIPSINAVDDFDKIEFCERLCKNSQVNKFIPETVLYDEPAILYNMISLYRTVYLKATKGRYSQSVMRIRKMNDNRFEYSKAGNKLEVSEVETSAELEEAVKDYFGSKKILVQRGIDTLVIGDSIIDMRAEVQRDEKGDLHVVAKSVRLGIEKSPVTSVRVGTSIFRFEDFFMNRFGWSKEKIEYWETVIDIFLYYIYESVEKEYGSFGEMGIDFAIDKNEQLWLIECNTKSAKVALYRSYDEKVIDQAFTNPMLYAKYLFEQK
ncbi:YheC/YheD family protein [Salipaludibacillus sp. CF4.18]|uniref:YheC/YheD family protein n=1 Tax=Salipaludibacillus sp. CF4.18 TaxID=3373081 RepID=UPI003EE5C6DE